MWWTEYIYSYFRIQSWLIITLMVFQIVFPFIIISKLISNLRESERKTGREKERETESNRGGCEWDITDTCPNSHREFILSHHQLIIFLCSLIPHTTDCLMPTSKPHTVPVHFLLCMVSILGQSKEHVDEVLTRNHTNSLWLYVQYGCWWESSLSPPIPHCNRQMPKEALRWWCHFSHRADSALLG